MFRTWINKLKLLIRFDAVTVKTQRVLPPWAPSIMLATTDPFCADHLLILSSFIQSCYTFVAVTRSTSQLWDHPTSPWLKLWSAHVPATLEQLFLWGSSPHFPNLPLHSAPLRRLSGEMLLRLGPGRGMGRGNNEVALLLFFGNPVVPNLEECSDPSKTLTAAQCQEDNIVLVIRIRR